MPEPTSKSGPLLTVYEAINGTLKEIYVGTTALSMQELIAENDDSPPPEIAHWKQSHDVNYRSIEFDLPAEGAARIIETYAKTIPVMGWKVLKKS